MNTRGRLAFLLLWSLCCMAVRGQGQSSRAAVWDVARRVVGCNLVYPQEKVYLHFDNTGYFIGETLRFKAYVVITDSGRLSRLSHVLYVELLNPGREVIARRKVLLEEGQGSGDIVLDQVFVPGFYEVRAYTRYVTNWGTDACFSRVFPVFKKPKKEGDYSDLGLDLPARSLDWAETRRLPSPEQNLFPRGWVADTAATDSARRIQPGGLLLPDVKVKGCRILGNPDRPAWKEESFGKSHAGIYYDMDAEAERILDRGEPLPTLMEWLPQHNPSFNGNASMFYSQLAACADTFHIKDTELRMESKLHLEEIPMMGIVDPKFRILNIGLGYNNNPILWIVDNSYFCTTRFPMGDYSRGKHGVPTTNPEKVGDFYRDSKKKGAYFLNEPRFSVSQKFPMFLDEVKSVYVTSAPSAYRAFIITNPMTWDAFAPVTVFVYTHHEFWSRKATGQRRTRFHGFNRATTFQMNDYSLMPPLPDDFRRTLLWEPNVRTDSCGHAHVEFYNNSTCKSILISAEGIAPDGTPLCNE